MNDSQPFKGFFCPECGQQNPARAKFCQHCGQLMPALATPPPTQTDPTPTPPPSTPLPVSMPAAPPPTVVVLRQGEEEEEEKKRGWLWFLLGLLLILSLLICGTTTQVIQISPAPADSNLPPFLASTINQVAAWQKNQGGGGGNGQDEGNQAACGPEGNWTGWDGDQAFAGVTEIDFERGEVTMEWLFQLEGGALQAGDTYYVNYQATNGETGQPIASSEKNGLYECRTDAAANQAICETPYLFFGTEATDENTTRLLLERIGHLAVGLQYGTNPACQLAADEIFVGFEDATKPQRVTITRDGVIEVSNQCEISLEGIELAGESAEAIVNENNNADEIIFTGLQGSNAPDAKFQLNYFADLSDIGTCEVSTNGNVICPNPGAAGKDGFFLSVGLGIKNCYELQVFYPEETIVEEGPDPEQEIGGQPDNTCTLPEFGQGKISLVSGVYYDQPYQVLSSPWFLRFDFASDLPIGLQPSDYYVEASVNNTIIPSLEDCYLDPSAELNQLFCKILPGPNQAGTAEIDLYVSSCTDPLLQAQSPLTLRTFEPTVTPTRKPPRPPEGGQELSCPSGQLYHGPNSVWPGGCCTVGHWCTLPPDSESQCWASCP